MHFPIYFLMYIGSVINIMAASNETTSISILSKSGDMEKEESDSQDKLENDIVVSEVHNEVMDNSTRETDNLELQSSMEIIKVNRHVANLSSFKSHKSIVEIMKGTAAVPVNEDFDDLGMKGNLKTTENLEITKEKIFEDRNSTNITLKSLPSESNGLEVSSTEVPQVELPNVYLTYNVEVDTDHQELSTESLIKEVLTNNDGTINSEFLAKAEKQLHQMNSTVHTNNSPSSANEDITLGRNNGGALTDFFHSYSIPKETFSTVVQSVPEDGDSDQKIPSEKKIEVIQIEDFLNITDHIVSLPDELGGVDDSIVNKEEDIEKDQRGFGNIETPNKFKGKSENPGTSIELDFLSQLQSFNTLNEAIEDLDDLNTITESDEIYDTPAQDRTDIIELDDDHGTCDIEVSKDSCQQSSATEKSDEGSDDLLSTLFGFFGF